MEAMMRAAQQAQQGQNLAPAAPVEVAKSGGGDTLPDVPVEHLDYGYISKCESVQELKDILAVLQSGKEGRWYDLEKHCEDKLVKSLPPKERRLYLAQRTEPSYEQKEDSAKELAAFVSGISSIDNTLKLQKRKPSTEKLDPRDEDTIFEHEEASSAGKEVSTRQFPPIRGTLSSAPQKKDEKSINISHRTPEEVARDEAERLKKHRLSGYDFRAWDKFDVDAELERLDKEEALERERKEAEIEERQAAIDARKQLSENSKASRDLHCDLEKLSDEQRNFFADREKEKGNESFKAGEFKDALNFYTRSITILPASSKDPRPYSNRAMANIKLERWEAAEQDCDEALTLDADFAKAYARRGMARHQRGKYLDAIDDFEEALHREPSNTKLNKLLAESRKKYNEVGGIGADRPGAPARQSAGKHTFKKLMIIEDSDDDDDDDEDSDAEAEAEAQSDSAAETKSEAAPKLDDKATLKTTSESAPSPLSQGDAKEAPVTNDKETKPEDIPNTKTSSESIEASDKDQMVGTEEDLQKSWVNAKRLGAEALRNGEVQKATIHFSKAINVLESLPRTAENQEHLVNCLGNKAVCLKESKEWNALVKVCDHVLSLDEENMIALFRRGIAREHLGQLQSALEDMCTVLRIDPNRTEAGERISVLMGKLNGTIPLGENKAKQMAAGKAKAQAEKATEDEAKTQEASKDETKVAKKSCSQNLSAPKEQVSPPVPPTPSLVKPSDSQASPPSSDALKENGNELFRAQKYHEALAKYKECLSIDPQNLSALANCAMALLKVEEYSECTKVCSTGLNAVQTLDDSAKAEQSSLKTKLLYRRACAHRELGQLEASCSDFEAVLAQEPGNKRASLELQKTKEAAQAAIRAKSERERLEKLNQAAKKQQDLAERAKERAKAKVEARTAFPAPNSSYEFQQMWRTLSLEKRAEYLNSFNPARLAKLFRIELPEDIFMDILAVLQSGPVTTDPEWSVKVLRNLSSVSSYSTTILFLSAQQKDTLRGILHQLSATDPTLQLAVLPN